MSLLTWRGQSIEPRNLNTSEKHHCNCHYYSGISLSPLIFFFVDFSRKSMCLCWFFWDLLYSSLYFWCVDKFHKKLLTAYMKAICKKPWGLVSEVMCTCFHLISIRVFFQKLKLMDEFVNPKIYYFGCIAWVRIDKFYSSVKMPFMQGIQMWVNKTTLWILSCAFATADFRSY